MKKIFFAVAVCFICTLPGIHAQNPEMNQAPYIEVVGVAEREIVPNEIFISIVLKEHEEGKEKITVEQQEIALKVALNDLKIPLENLYLSDANSNYVKVGLGKREVIARTEYILKVTDANTVGNVFEKLDVLKIQEAGIQRVNHSNIQEIKKEIRILAIKAAKEKADYLLNAIGEKTGNALVVKELDGNNIAFYTRTANIAEDSFKLRSFSDSYNDAELTTLQFRKMKIESSVYVKFQINK